MAESRLHGLAPQLDIEQILLEAQNRWLRPAEICEILQNYRKFSIAPMPPHKPSSGSLFLFDRKVLRYFRKDGHNWRKKKDGKTVKEAHERLKADSVDVLHCYYAHGEENENFQRRTYWMLEEAFMHIVLVHYLEVKVNKSSFVGIKDDEFEQLTNVDSPICSSFVSYSQLPSLTMEAGSPTSAQTIEYERAESDNHQGRHRHLPFLELQQCTDCPLTDASNLNPSSALPSQISDYDHQTVPIVSNCGYHKLAKEVMTKILNEASQASHFNSAKEPSDVTSCKEICREPLVHIVGDKQKVAADHQAKAEVQLLDSEGCSLIFPEKALNTAILLDRKMKNSSLVKQASWDIFNIEGEGLKKYDSFSRWMSKELGEVDDSHAKSSSQSYWNFIESERLEDSSMISAEQLDSYTMSPSVSQDQLFSIIDFSPSWAYAGLVTKVLITGKFLKSKKDLENCKWSCMFGDVEVPAEILADCVLRCDAPSHRPGAVPFYITCSNRLSCSEVREFEFRANHTQYMETTDLQCSSINELCLCIRLGMLLSLDYLDHSNSVNNMTPEQLNLSNKISLQLVDADDDRLYILDRNKEISVDSLKDQLLQKLFKEQLHDWLVRKIDEGDKGPCVHDKEGQGVLHLAAALDYDWAIKPMIDAGVSINFRDVQGWTALHWAAFCGRERTVVSLLTLGAAPGALTDPTPEFPSGRTPADLASVNGHKGIAGFLAESSLTAHLEILTLKCTRGFDVPEVTRTKDMVGFVENYDDDAQDGAAMKESLSAVRNATHAAACIHQVFRVQSFQRKKLGRYGAVSDEETFSLISIRTNKPGHNTPSHSAAICIQNKFRGWKGRKEFLIIRQRIVKIQAYVRGHQVRKQYKKIVWTVGILEKVILRWRRKGSGLRGFRSESLLKSTSDEAIPPKEGEYDFLQDGRKQTEVRLQKALVRVRSMVQYPEARDQYCRLATIVSELQHSKALHDESSNEAKDAAEGDLMMEFEELFDEDPSAQTS